MQLLAEWEVYFSLFRQADEDDDHVITPMELFKLLLQLVGSFGHAVWMQFPTAFSLECCDWMVAVYGTSLDSAAIKRRASQQGLGGDGGGSAFSPCKQSIPPSAAAAAVCQNADEAQHFLQRGLTFVNFGRLMMYLLRARSVFAQHANVAASNGALAANGQPAVALDVVSLRNALESLSIPASLEDVQVLIASFDENASERMEWDEFVKLLLSWKATGERFLETFRTHCQMNTNLLHVDNLWAGIINSKHFFDKESQMRDFSKFTVMQLLDTLCDVKNDLHEAEQNVASSAPLQDLITFPQFCSVARFLEQCMLPFKRKCGMRQGVDEAGVQYVGSTLLTTCEVCEWLRSPDFFRLTGGVLNWTPEQCGRRLQRIAFAAGDNVSGAFAVDRDFAALDVAASLALDVRRHWNSWSKRWNASVPESEATMNFVTFLDLAMA